MKTWVPPDFHHPCDAVVIGASAGGVQALLEILPGLPANWPLPVIVLVHMADDRASLLAEVFSHRLRRPVREALDKAAIEPGTVYFAPSGYHLLVERDRCFSLSLDEREHFSRPSIDVLLGSAADAWGPRLTAVLLTGANADGAAGLAQVGRAGGLTVVQDPQQAQSPYMPQAAIDLAPPHFALPLAGIRQLLLQLDPTP
jgi:two-component system chemotaxis response regulator CheB